MNAIRVDEIGNCISVSDTFDGYDQAHHTAWHIESSTGTEFLPFDVAITVKKRELTVRGQQEVIKTTTTEGTNMDSYVVCNARCLLQ